MHVPIFAVRPENSVTDTIQFTSPLIRPKEIRTGHNFTVRFFKIAGNIKRSKQHFRVVVKFRTL